MSKESLNRIGEYSPLESREFSRKPEFLVLSAAFFRLNADGAQPDLLSPSPFDETWGVEIQGETGFVKSCTSDPITVNTGCENL